MSKFIKLTNYVINTNAISHILAKENKFIITLQTPKINGFIMLSSGGITTKQDIFEIENIAESEDYQKVKKWIDSIE